MVRDITRIPRKHNICIREKRKIGKLWGKRDILDFHGLQEKTGHSRICGGTGKPTTSRKFEKNQTFEKFGPTFVVIFQPTCLVVFRPKFIVIVKYKFKVTQRYTFEIILDPDRMLSDFVDFM